SDRGSSFFFSSRRRHTRFSRDWSSDVCSSDLMKPRRGISNLFLLRWARAAHDEIVSYANGSTFLEISKASFRQIRVIVPCQRVRSEERRVGRERRSRCHRGGSSEYSGVASEKA